MARTIQMTINVPQPKPGCPYCGKVDTDPATHIREGRCK